METLIVERKDGVVTVTMNRPERKNAANGTMWRELQAVLEERSPQLGADVLAGIDNDAPLTWAGGDQVTVRCEYAGRKPHDEHVRPLS